MDQLGDNGGNIYPPTLLNQKNKMIWIDQQPLIGGNILIWYYCEKSDKVKTKLI